MCPHQGSAVSEGIASSAIMDAAACCLTAHGLRLPADSACPPLGPQQGASALPLWRPWLPRAQERLAMRREEIDPARAAEGDGGPGKALVFFQHPVRLLWPKSKAFDHLYSVGEKLLENFPVQATLFFYEDSGSEEEEEEEEEEEGDDEEEEATGDVTAGHPRYASSHGPNRPA